MGSDGMGREGKGKQLSLLCVCVYVGKRAVWVVSKKNLYSVFYIFFLDHHLKFLLE